MCVNFALRLTSAVNRVAQQRLSTVRVSILAIAGDVCVINILSYRSRSDDHDMSMIDCPAYGVSHSW